MYAGYFPMGLSLERIMTDGGVQTAAQMRKLEANYARSTTLAQQKLISANDIDQIKYDLESARASLDLAGWEDVDIFAHS